MMSKVLVTGATGFIGRHFCALRGRYSGGELRLAVRHELSVGDPLQKSGTIICVGDLGAGTDWREALHGVDAVVHLASRVHVMNDHDLAIETLYRQANVLGTRCLGEAAVAAGVKRFIFVSSVKAIGESGLLASGTSPNPQDAYGRSKLAAETALLEVASGSGMAVTILRSPLVYGAGVGANFLRLMRVIDRGIPLPLSSIENERSMIYVGNLVSAIQQALHPELSAAGTFFVSDGKPLSTPALVREIATAMSKAPNLWPCPLPLLRLFAALGGKSGELSRLVESLVVDDGPLREALSWTPPFTLAEGLRETVGWYSHQP